MPKKTTGDPVICLLLHENVCFSASVEILDCEGGENSPESTLSGKAFAWWIRFRVNGYRDYVFLQSAHQL